MTRSLAILLGDIVEAAELIQQYTEGVTFETFAENPEKQKDVPSLLARVREILETASDPEPSDES